MTRKQIRDINEECQRQETCVRCPYYRDSNCAILWRSTRSIPECKSYEELVRIAKKEGLLDDD